MAAEIGIELLTEEQYRELQQLGEFDTKTSSWLKTPDEVRKLGGSSFRRSPLRTRLCLLQYRAFLLWCPWVPGLSQDISLPMF